jgi:DNA-binding transcriptional MerR regulator
MSKVVTISQASLLSGVPADTIRDWDDRGWIKVARDRNGLRVFTNADINSIRKVRRQTAQGVRSRAVMS